MFLLVPAHLGCLGQNPESRKTVVCLLHVFVCVDQLFLILYKELYYRHVYARVQVICIALVLKIIVAGLVTSTVLNSCPNPDAFCFWPQCISSQ